MVELGIVLLLVGLNGLFAGAEIALLSVRRTRVEELVGEGRAGARWVAELRAHPERLFATVQVGITVVSATAGTFGGATAAEHLAGLLRPALGGNADGVALALVIAGLSYLSLVLGELVPKSLALRSAESYALLVAPVLAALAWAARPLVWLLTTSSNVVLRVFGDQTSFVESRLSGEELRQLVDEAASAGTVDERAGDIASRALDLAELDVADVLVPRTEVVGLPRGASTTDLAALAGRVGHSRILLFGRDPDDVLGYVTVRDALARAVVDGPHTLEVHLRSSPFVPTSMRATALLRELQASGAPLAVAVDERGTVRGLVTLTDLLEELVGTLHPAGRPPVVVPEGPGRWLAQAAVPLRDLARAMGHELPEPVAATTLGGLVLERAQRIPEVGAVVSLGDLDAEVVEASRRRVKAVRLTLRASG